MTVPGGIAAVLMLASLQWEAEGSMAGEQRLKFLKNGGNFAGNGDYRLQATALGATPIIMTLSGLIPCAPGDTFEVQAGHTQGTATDIINANQRTWFSIIGFSGIG